MHRAQHRAGSCRHTMNSGDDSCCYQLWLLWPRPRPLLHSQRWRRAQASDPGPPDGQWSALAGLGQAGRVEGSWPLPCWGTRSCGPRSCWAHLSPAPERAAASACSPAPATEQLPPQAHRVARTEGHSSTA